jgi:hypothetical protein
MEGAIRNLFIYDLSNWGVVCKVNHHPKWDKAANGKQHDQRKSHSDPVNFLEGRDRLGHVQRRWFRLWVTPGSRFLPRRLRPVFGKKSICDFG